LSRFSACLFDLDGVLVDTAVYHYRAWKRLAAELGFDFTEKDNERLKGISRMASLEILLEIGGLQFDDAAKLELADRKNRYYLDYIMRMDESAVLPGAVDFLKACRERGIKTALGSASKNAMTILQRTGLTPLFDAVIDGNKATKAKPDPEVFLLGARELGVEPPACVVFEDAEAGVEAARRAGMRCVGIGSPAILHKADRVIPSLAAVTVDDILEGMG